MSHAMRSKVNNIITKVDSTLPWGIYIPPRRDNHNHNHNGYIRVIDRRGKSFQCGFSKPAIQPAFVEAGVKRSLDEISQNMHNSPDDCMADNITETHGGMEPDTSDLNEKTIAEECLHPEEALFLHMRGLLRIESIPKNKDVSSEQKGHATMSTQQLMNEMLPECNVSLTAYLAYAHLREQGYILMRYTTKRISLLREMDAMTQRQINGEALTASNEAARSNIEADVLIKETNPSDQIEGIAAPKKDLHNDMYLIDNQHIYKKKSIKQKYKDDVVNAPPPCIVGNELNSIEQDATTLSLSYLAYNPNAEFKRTDPGWPDFGVAIMTFYSHGEKSPTHDTISSLLSLCRCDDGLVCTNNSVTQVDVPLRIITVSDGAAVVAFGVIDGDVPIIIR